MPRWGQGYGNHKGRDSPAAAHTQVCAACHPAGAEDLRTGVESWREDPPATRRGGGHPSTLSPPRSPGLPQHLSSGLSLASRCDPRRCLPGSEQMEKDGEWILRLNIFQGLPRWLSGKESAYQCRRHRFNSWVGRIPWRRKWQPTTVSLPGKSHG